jgi:hypothetical protein
VGDSFGPAILIKELLSFQAEEPLQASLGIFDTCMNNTSVSRTRVKALLPLRFQDDDLPSRKSQFSRDSETDYASAYDNTFNIKHACLCKLYR